MEPITLRGDIQMTELAQKLKDCFSYNDYLQWDTGRWELIDGIVYDMTPAPSRQHQKILMDLAAIIHGQVSKGPCEVYVTPFDVRLPDSADVSVDEIITVVQPDIVIVCDQTKLDERGCLGAPDLVVEILSPATAAKDLKIKRDLYERHGIKKYWVVHPVDKFFMIYRPGEDNLYQKATVLSGEDVITSSAVDDVEINLEDIFGKVEEKRSLPPVR